MPVESDEAFPDPDDKIFYCVAKAESPYPRPKYLKLAKEMGAKFSFGSNNYDAAPKDLSRWLEVILWLDLKADDIWQPTDVKPL